MVANPLEELEKVLAIVNEIQNKIKLHSMSSQSHIQPYNLMNDVYLLLYYIYFYNLLLISCANFNEIIYAGFMHAHGEEEDAQFKEQSINTLVNAISLKDMVKHYQLGADLVLIREKNGMNNAYLREKALMSITFLEKFKSILENYIPKYTNLDLGIHCDFSSYFSSFLISLEEIHFKHLKKFLYLAKASYAYMNKPRPYSLLYFMTFMKAHWLTSKLNTLAKNETAEKVIKLSQHILELAEFLSNYIEIGK